MRRDEQSKHDAEVLIRLHGTFDVDAAWDVRGRLGRMPHDALVVIDFSQVDEFLDLGMAVMAPGLATPECPHVVLRGLRHHQQRLLRYLGVAVPDRAPSPDDAS